jgi:sugar/nucleoside kinase (ribokinase family)
MTFAIIGFGQVIWDLTVDVEYSFLEELSIGKGGHKIIPLAELETIIEEVQNEYSEKIITRNPGGSTANLMSNLAKLGTRTAFVGKHGNDQDGREFMTILEKGGVKPFSIVDPEKGTGKLLSLITPDKDRTFIVYRGASEVLPAKMIKEDYLKKANIIHLEGYLMINSENAVWKILRKAKETTIDLAAYTVVEQTKELLIDMMTQYPQKILFSNIHEGRKLTGKEGAREIVTSMLKYSKIAVLTLGEKGVIVADQEGALETIPAIPTKVRDTTGAGDSFCAGFLHSYLKNGDIVKAGKLGVKTASLTISRLGARSLEPELLQ